MGKKQGDFENTSANLSQSVIKVLPKHNLICQIFRGFLHFLNQIEAFLKVIDSSLSSDGSGSKIFELGWVKFLLLGLGQVSHLWFEFTKFLLKIPNFSIFCI